MKKDSVLKTNKLITMKNNLVFKEIYNKKEWENHLLNLHTSDVYSSWIWGEYKQRVGWGIYRLSVWDKEQNSLMACFQLQKKIKFKLFTILVIQGGIHLKTLSLNKHHQVLESIMNKYVTGKNNVIIFINQQSASSQNIDTGLLMCKFSPILNSKSYTYILDSNNNYSLLKLNPETGRKHQLRRQLLLHGHPILGDTKYRISINKKGKSNNLMLHAYKINFSISSLKYNFLAKPPKNFLDILSEKYLKIR